MLVLAHLHRSVLTQQVHSLGHLAFKWRSSFAKALAKLSSNFREKSPNSFYKMIHIYKINTKHKYLQCNLDICTWTFAKTLARKKFTFAISEKTLAETVNCIPKGLRKGNPFHGPFAQLSYLIIRKIYKKTCKVIITITVYAYLICIQKKSGGIPIYVLRSRIWEDKSLTPPPSSPPAGRCGTKTLGLGNGTKRWFKIGETGNTTKGIYRLHRISLLECNL